MGIFNGSKKPKKKKASKKVTKSKNVCEVC